MGEPLAKERKSHITTVLPNDLLDEMHAYHGEKRVAKATLIENALRKFFASERAAGEWDWNGKHG